MVSVYLQFKAEIEHRKFRKEIEAYSNDSVEQYSRKLIAKNWAQKSSIISSDPYNQAKSGKMHLALKIVLWVLGLGSALAMTVNIFVNQKEGSCYITGACFAIFMCVGIFLLYYVLKEMAVFDACGCTLKSVFFDAEASAKMD